MSKTLRDFIETRRAQLDQLEAPLLEELSRVQAQLEAIEAERRDLDAAAGAINAMPDHGSITRRYVPEMTIKEAVLKVLHAEPNGLAATEILRRINSELRTDYARTSLSPQLSRLKQEGKIELYGQLWKLAGFEGLLANMARMMKPPETKPTATEPTDHSDEPNPS
ncbi:MAG: hypothetical protein WC689_03280 [Methylocystis sp.]